MSSTRAGVEEMYGDNDGEDSGPSCTGEGYKERYNYDYPFDDTSDTETPILDGSGGAINGQSQHI